MSDESKVLSAGESHAPEVQHARLREQFQAAWTRALGSLPCIDDFLAAFPEPERSTLAHEILQIDLEYRARLRTAGDTTPPGGGTPSGPGDTVDTTPRPAVDPGVTVDPEQGRLLAPSNGLQAQTVDPEQGVVLPLTVPTSASKQNRPSIPGYAILGELGRGGMGVVYKAEQIDLNRLVAIKMILAGGHAGPDERVRFYSEARAVASLKHPNIIQIYQIDEQDGLPYFSLEFVEGGSLDRKINRTPQPVRAAAELVRTLAQAMQTAHQAGIVHRDLKPANVLLTPDGTPKITDFGLAKRLEGDSSQTRSGALVGTPSYMSPEQARGELAAVGPLADVWALGAILYELLTGRPPFQGAAVLETLELVQAQEPVAPSQLQPKVPLDLETICLKCLQKEPRKRYASAGDLAADLGRYLAGEPIHARPVSTTERVWRWCKRNPRVAVLGAAVILLVLVFAGSSWGFTWTIAQQKNEVEKQKQTAEAATVKETEARQAETLAHQATRESRTLAASQTTVALGTIRSILFQIQDVIRSQPELIPFRQAILDLALRELTKVAQELDKDKLYDRSSAGAHAHMGDSFIQGGKPTVALERFQRAHDIIVALKKDEPDEPVHRRNLAAILNKQGDAHLLLGDAAKAKECYEKALESRREWAKMLPNVAVTQQAIAESHGLIGNVHLKMGDPQAALKNYQASRKTYDELPKEIVNQLGVRQELAALEQRLGQSTLQSGNLNEGRTHYQSALKQREQLATAVRGNANLLRDVAYSRIDLGDLELTWQGEAAQALPHYQSALQELTQIQKASPKSIPYQMDLATANYRLGTAYQRLAATPTQPFLLARLYEVVAHAYYLQAFDLFRAVAILDQRNTDAWIKALLAQAHIGQHAEAAKLADVLVQNSPKDARILFHAACGYALCIPVPQESSTRELYTKKALDTLTAALANGWKDVVALDKDPDLDPLRALPAFATMRKTLKR